MTPPRPKQTAPPTSSSAATSGVSGYDLHLARRKEHHQTQRYADAMKRIPAICMNFDISSPLSQPIRPAGEGRTNCAHG